MDDCVSRREDRGSERLAQYFMTRASEQHLGLRRPFSDCTVRVPRDERVVRRLDESANSIVGRFAAQLGAGACDELVAGDWLREVIVGAELQTAYTVAEIAVTGDEDHGKVRRRLPGPQSFDHLEPAESGKVTIED